MSEETESLLKRAESHDKEALGELFTRYAPRLRRLVQLRLDRRLQGRIDVSDVLQESYLDILKSFHNYTRQPDRPFFVWLRCIVIRTLLDLHRRHLGAQARDACRELSLNQGYCPEATSAVLAAHLVGTLTTPSETIMRAERKAALENGINHMDPIDREVLALRHFEQLSNMETAQVLGISTSAASKRHLRALKRLKDILKTEQ